MNRLILIGNGFDLAHDLKTSYKNFINYFWDKQIEKMLSSTLKAQDNEIFFYQDNDDFIEASAPHSIWEFIEKTTDPLYKGFNLFLTYNPEPIKNTDNAEFICKNDFLFRISKKSSLEKWVDIEYEYYLALIECLNDNEDVNKLNNEFSQIKNALELYLTEQNKCKINISNNIKKIFFSNTDADKDVVFFLNFNYTKTLNHYTYATKNTKTINVHGELNNVNNPIIFGYGDELDENYKNIEKINDKSFLENIKSSNYSITNNYKELLAFINAEEYEVFIIGHSCGLSDRTLLNTIFENKYCKSVKIFYHQKDAFNDNFIDTYINLSRNFNDKKLLREIVVSKENSIPLKL